MGTLHDWAVIKNINSMRRLAAEMQGRPGSPWPTGDNRSQTTIATKLAELDRGKDVDWWWGTGAAFRPALAFVLGRELGELDALRPQAEAGHQFAFAGFPTLRPLDLRIEPPFPGVPRELVMAGGPTEHRCWWVAPPGAGKTVVGRWLEQRAGWVYLAGSRWRDVANALPAAGRVYLELTSAEGHAELLEGYPGLRVCVACPERPQRPRRRDTRAIDEGNIQGVEDDGPDDDTVARQFPDAGDKDNEQGVEDDDRWALVQGPALSEWLPELVSWARARVEAGGGFSGAGPQAFDAEELEALVHTPGEALELFGVIDDVGFPEDGEWTPRALRRWVTTWLRHALGRIGAPSAPARQLSQKGGELIVELVAARLRRGLSHSLTAAEWAALLPTTKQELDPAELIRLVQAGGENLQQRLLDALAATPEAIVALLRQVGALAPQPGAAAERLALRPRWLAEVAKAKAVEGMYEGPAADLGALLLEPETAGRILERMIADITDGDDTPARRALEADVRTPEGAAALDGAVRGLGIAAAQGTAVDLLLAERLLSKQALILVKRYAGAVPKQPVLAVALGETERAGDPAGWYLATLALGHALAPRAEALVPPALFPWCRPAGAPPATNPALDHVLRMLGSACVRDRNGDDSSPLRRAIYRFGGVLYQTLGPPDPGVGELDPRQPQALVQLVKSGEAPHPAQHLNTLRLAFGLDVLDEACARNGITLDQVLAWCWRCWGAVGINEECTPLWWVNGHKRPVHQPDLEALWAAADPASIGDSLAHAITQSPKTFRFLRPELWRRVVQACTRLTGAHWMHIESRISEAAPVEVLLDALLALPAFEDRPSIYATLWRRGAPALRTKVAELLAALPDLGDENGPLAMIYWYAPPDEHPGLIVGLGGWLHAPGAAVRVDRWVWHWLLQRVDGRRPGWRDAFALVELHRDPMTRTLAAQA